MGKWCNFDTNDDGQLVCLEHSPVGAPALHAHAAADLEQRLVTITKVIQMHQPVGSPPPGDEAMLAAWVLNVLESRLARLEEEKAQLQRYPFEPVCLNCGRLTPCMTEADLKPGDLGVPCTFDPTPRQLFDQNAVIIKRLAQAEAREAWVRSQLDAQYLAGVEWGVKHVSKREDWPQSWDAGFPGFKGQALIDRGPLSPDAGRTP